MTRKILFFLLTTFALVVSSCLDVEEKIVINKDNSGSYTLTMDLGRLLKMTNEMGGDKKEAGKTPEVKDSTAYFKPYVDTSSVLTDEEKAMLRDGSVHMKMDEVKSEMKIMINLPFKNLKDLPKLRESYMKALDKAGIMNKMKDKKSGEDSVAQEMSSDMGTNSKTINPVQNAYTFSAAPGRLSYRFTDKKVYEEKVTNDSTLQSMKGMAAMLGDMNYKTVIMLPRTIKNYKGKNSTISGDRKTISFRSSLTEIMKDPQSLEFDLEY